MAKKPTYFQERKAFIARMIKEGTKISYPREQKFAKDIFEEWPVDFLNLVKRPFELDSLAYFLSEKGEKYLRLRFLEYLYKPKEIKIIPGDVKQGDNWKGSKKLTFRDFLS